MLLLTALLLLDAAIVGILARDLLSARRVPLLMPHPAAPGDGSDVTVIIPARNEAQRIGRCLAGLADQGLAELEVIVLDDDSRDGTHQVARAWQDRLPGLRVVRGAPLPAGWTGKCWACWQAAQQSTRTWLLFLDADTAPQPGLIAALLHYARREGCGLLSLLPLLELGSFWERVIMPAFTGMIQAVFPLDRVNDPRSPLAMANGQCILIRRELYMAVDGHRAIRNSVLEDVHLAQLVKGRGARLAVVGGPALLRVRMYTSLAEISEGLRKNALAGARAGGFWRALWGGLRQMLLAFAPLSLILLGTGLVLAEHGTAKLFLTNGILMALITLGYWGLLVRRLNGLHPLWGVAFPLGTLSYMLLAARAFVANATGRGVTWKERAYRQ